MNPFVYLLTLLVEPQTLSVVGCLQDQVACLTQIVTSVAYQATLNPKSESETSVKQLNDWFSAWDRLVVQMERLDVTVAWPALVVWTSSGSTLWDGKEDYSQDEKFYDAFRFYLRGFRNFQRHRSLYWTVFYIRVATILTFFGFTLYPIYRKPLYYGHSRYICLSLVFIYISDRVFRFFIARLSPAFVFNPHHYETQLARKSDRARPFHEVFRRYSRGRRFCVTTNGLKCWVPHAARTGDSFAMIRGTQWPLVLRPSGFGYVLIGTAYVLDHTQPSQKDWVHLKMTEMRIV